METLSEWMTFALVIALFVAVLALYFSYRLRKKQPKATPTVYQAMTHASPRRAKQSTPQTFARTVDVAPEMATLRDGFGKIRTAQQLIASLSPELQASLEPLISNVSEKHLAQIISDAMGATQKLQQMELQRQLEIEMSIVDNETMIANVAEQFRIVQRLESLLYEKTPQLTSPVGQAVWQAVIYTEIKKHLDTLGVASDLREKVLAPLETYVMLEDGTSMDETDLNIKITNLSAENEETYSDFVVLEA